MRTACWRSSTCPRSRAHQNCDGNARRQIEKEMPTSEQRVHQQLVGKQSWVDRADLRCAMGKASSSLGRATDTDMRNIKSILRYLRGTPGIMIVRPTTLNLEDVNRAPVGSVLTYGDSDTAGDVDRFSVSGTASWLRGKLAWYPITASSRKQSMIALSSGEAELVAALSGACEGMSLRQQWDWLLKFGCNAEETSETTQQILCCDSSAALGMIKRKGSTRKTRHIELKAFILQQWSSARPKVRLVQVETSETLADGVTKIEPTPNSIYLEIRIGDKIQS